MEESEKSDPYQAISHFFAFGIIDSTRETLKDWFDSAFARDACWDHTPGSLVFQHGRIIKLIDAAHILYKMKYGSLDQSLPDYSHSKFPDDPLDEVRSIARKINDWNQFPYLVIQIRQV